MADCKCPPLSTGHKQVGHEKLPSRHSKATQHAAGVINRSNGNYSKTAKDPDFSQFGISTAGWLK